MNDRRGLAGRRIVVTRAAEQADSLAELLAERGAEPVVVPLVRIVDEPSGLAALAALDPAGFDWVIVTSPNAAQHLAARVRAGGPGVRALAAVGSATAAVAHDAGLTVDLVPRRQSAEGLLDEFAAPPGATALVVQAVDATPTLVSGLRDQGLLVTAVAPYRTVPTTPGAAQQLAALAADAVLFASGSAARAWVEVFGTSTPPIVVAIGPSTAEAAAAAGLKVTAVAADHSLVGMVDTLERRLRGEG